MGGGVRELLPALLPMAGLGGGDDDDADLVMPGWCDPESLRFLQPEEAAAAAPPPPLRRRRRLGGGAGRRRGMMCRRGPWNPN